MLTDAIMAQITKRHQGPSMTRALFDEGFQCLHEVFDTLRELGGLAALCGEARTAGQSPHPHSSQSFAKSLHENLPEPRLHQKCGHPGVSAALGREGVGHGQA